MVTYTCDEIHTNTSWICRGCLYLRRAVCRTSSRVYAFLLLLDFPKRRFDCENLISRALPPRRIPSQRVKSHTSTWLRIFPWFYRIPHCSLIYINFSQNHCLREFWNLYLIEYNREAMEIARISIYGESLLSENHDEYIAAILIMYNVTFLIV